MLVECSGREAPGAHVADAVALVVKSGEGQPEAKDDRKQKWVEDSLVRFPNCKQVGWGTWLRTHLLNLLLKQLSGIPLRDTVVNGTRQSGFERFFGNSCFSSFVLPSASVEELSLYIFPSPSSAYMAALWSQRSTKLQLFTETCLISSTKAEIRASICTACRENTWKLLFNQSRLDDDGSRSYLQDLWDTPSILNDAELDEETGQAVLIVLLARLGVIPRELLKLQTKQHNLVNLCCQREVKVIEDIIKCIHQLYDHCLKSPSIWSNDHMTHHINGVDDVEALTVDRDQHLAVLLRKLDHK